MYTDPINITKDVVPHKMESFEINIPDPTYSLYTEAVFADGKSKLQPIIDDFKAIQDDLNKQISMQEDRDSLYDDWKKNGGTKPTLAKFDPVKFWKDPKFKKLEDDIQKIFGFRSVIIMPYKERYSSKQKEFESYEFNAFTYSINRYPIEGLVTNSGFYDKSRSITLEAHISLGIIKNLTVDEIVAVLLHEIGHNIDPALMDIKYTEINVLSKYLTNRKGAISNAEKKAVDKRHGVASEILVPLIVFGLYAINAILIILTNVFPHGKGFINKTVERLRKQVRNDKEGFNPYNSTEAFADNFARMYGFGPALASSFKKMQSYTNKHLDSWIALERERQDVMLRIIENTLKDVHKTDIHRYRSLIREYEKELADPDIPAKVKKAIKEDKDEMEKLLDEYLDSFTELQNRINQMINEELKDKEIGESLTKWDAVPLKEVNGVKFGMARYDVRKILGEYHEFKKSAESKSNTDDFKICHVYYSEDNKCEAIEVFDDCQVLIKGNVVFPTSIESAKKHIPDLESSDDAHYISKKMSIAIEMSDGKAKGILFGKAGYFKNSTNDKKSDDK